jgi:hypothetical protein
MGFFIDKYVIIIELADAPGDCGTTSDNNRTRLVSLGKDIVYQQSNDDG